MKHIGYMNIWILAFVFASSINNVYAQFSRSGTPFSIHRRLTTEVPTTNLPFIDNARMNNVIDSMSRGASCIDCKEKYYGKGIDMPIDIKNTGRMETMADGSKLWLLKISSATAYGMQFYFDKFHLPFDATLFIYNENKTAVLGAFTSDNNNPDSSKLIQFGTQWIAGNSIYLEYREPANPEFDGEIRITKVIHIFKEMFNIFGGPFGNALPCNINVACPEGLTWEKEINSVALILAYDATNDLVAQCSGAIINNTSEDGRPLFLSANHCIDIPDNNDPAFNFLYDYSTWLFLFNHQTKTCNSDGSDVNSSTAQSVYGSILLAHDAHNSPASDYLLVELNTSKAILSAYGVCYAGWTLDNPQPPVTGIHHPAGDVKKISKANSVVDFSTIYWEVDWDKGTTQGISSGSPLFDNTHRIIGQIVYGKKPYGTDDCYPAKITGYGKFSASWQSGNFAFWLDPYSTGKRNINTYCSSSCTDLVKNGNETGIDCGGNCPPCPTGGGGGGGSSSCKVITYQINSRNTNTNGILNVCKYNLIISPHSYNANCSAEWLHTTVHTRTNHIPCFLAGTPPGMPDNCFTDLTPFFWLGLPDNSCVCMYRKLFLSLQECDNNKNIIGPEYSHWFDIHSGFSSFNLNGFLPSGASIVEGKYYKVKMGTSAGGTWSEHSSFIRVYTENLLIQNETITHDQFANMITLQNATVPAALNIKVVAKTRIEVLPNTALGSGAYYIKNFDCSSLDQFNN